jgi:hypothetical protein
MGVLATFTNNCSSIITPAEHAKSAGGQLMRRPSDKTTIGQDDKLIKQAFLETAI